MPAPVLTADELNAFLHEAVPGAPRDYGVESVTDGGVRLRMPVGVGNVPLAVTSTLTINFLAKPQLVDLYADAALLRLGARSSVTEVRLSSGTNGPLVAHATVGYSIPA